MDLNKCILISGKFLLTFNIFFLLAGVYFTYLIMKWNSKRIIKKIKRQYYTNNYNYEV